MDVSNQGKSSANKIPPPKGYVYNNLFNQGLEKYTLRKPAKEKKKGTNFIRQV